MSTCSKIHSVSIVGAGLIGQSLGVLFVSNGLKVKFFDATFLKDPDIIKKTQLSFVTKIEEHVGHDASEMSKLAAFSPSLEDCLENVDFVYECVFENVDVKKTLLAEIDRLVGPNTIMASSTSCIMPSLLSESLKNRHNFLVAHPINPPTLIKLVEIVPAPWTEKGVVGRVKSLMEQLGQKPVCMIKEADGFALNRVQYAVVNACWSLVKEGLLSPEDVDNVMLFGLGPRYACLGAFQVMHLNAPGGFSDYMRRYGDTLRRVSGDIGQEIDYDQNTQEVISSYLYSQIPGEQIPNRLRQRDEFLKKAQKLKTD